ncbi:unnamed protein product [Candidula unifasciata]|uniref:Sugar phosphate transporter domain-containing protein n=1 Tax=Candidula unifasciata TaxID=100452 RepID=A0A8S3ZMN7_9EUPU|nr:unnamed protein product [Candidula unifasciata]
MNSHVLGAGLPTAVQHSIFLIAAVVICHWVVAISLVFINKSLVNEQAVEGDISMFIVWVQNVVGVVTVLIMHLVSSFVNLPWHPPFVSLSTVLHPDMVMASVTFTGTLVFNNLMLKHISVAFYQAARSLTLLFVITFSVFILHEKITSRLMLSCLCIVCGFYVCVDEELLSQGVSPVGIIYGVVASMFAALCGVFFKRIQKKKRVSSMELAVNNCLISSVGLTPLVISTSQIDNFLRSPASGDATLWSVLLFSGCLSLTMGWVSALQISLTSPLTHNISINAKSVFQTVLVVMWSGESRASMWWFGNGLVMTGIATYTANRFKVAQQNAVYNTELEIKEPPRLDERRI